MQRKTFLASLFSFGLFAQSSEEKKEKVYRNGECPVCATPVSAWNPERKCDATQSKDVIKPRSPFYCSSFNEVTGSEIYQHHVCKKCKTIFAYIPQTIKSK